MKETLHPFDDTDRSALATFRAAVQANSAPMTRASYDLQLERIPDAPGVSYASGSLGGVKGTWCTLAGARAGTTILYLHGGAFVLGSAQAFRHFAGQIAARAMAPAIAVKHICRVVRCVLLTWLPKMKKIQPGQGRIFCVSSLPILKN